MGSLRYKSIPLSYDIFNRLEDFEVILCKATGEEIQSLKINYNPSYKLNLSSPDEFSFTIYNKIDGADYKVFDLIEAKLLIEVVNIGIFIIKNVDITNYGEYSEKQVECVGYEANLGKKDLVLLEGLYTVSQVIAAVTGSSPRWSVGQIDPLLLTKERYFDFVTVSSYDFLMTTASEAFECLFTFNTLDFSISATAFENVGNQSNMLLSHNNSIKTLKLFEDSDNIVTALSVLGSNDLDIRLMNPNGTNVIYDFGYYVNRPDYYNFMSTALMNKIIQYEIDFDSKQEDYSDLLELYNETLFCSIVEFPSDEQKGILQLNSEILEVEANIEVREGIIADRIRGGVSYEDITTEIQSYTARKSVLNGLLAIKKTALQNCISQLDTINNFLKIENYFAGMLTELDAIIFSGVYTDNKFLITDSMTAPEINNISKELYDKGVSVLGRVSRPKITMEIDGADFLANIDLYNLSSELIIGNTILVRIGEDEVREVRLVGINYSFSREGNSLQLTFSDYYKNYEGAFGFQDLITTSISAATSLSYNSSSYENWSSTYKTDVAEFIKGALNASVNKIKSNSNNEMTMNQNGIRGKKWNGINYDLEEIWIVNNMIAFSDDNFETARMAVGKIPDPLNPGNSLYGVVADALVGRVIIGEALGIENTSGSFKVDESGVTITDLDMILTNSAGLRKLLVDPETGIKISTRPNASSSWTDKFYVDTNGDLKITGALVGGSINIGNGVFTVNNSGVLSATGANISGNISMTSGTISWASVNTDPVASAAASSASTALTTAQAIAAGTYSGGTFISNKTVYSPTLQGGQVIGATVKTANSGIRMEMTPSGLRSYDANGTKRGVCIEQGAYDFGSVALYHNNVKVGAFEWDTLGTVSIGPSGGATFNVHNATATGNWSFSSASVSGLTVTAVFG